MLIEVVELLLPKGVSPFSQWFNSLDAIAAAKIRIALSRMEGGNLAAIKWFRGIGECRIDWGPGYRIYLAKDGPALILLLGGGTKKRQQKDIEEALKIWEQYKRTKTLKTRGN
jgi:putative addiction module killer protein